jgi:hypothetical protein
MWRHGSVCALYRETVTDITKQEMWYDIARNYNKSEIAMLDGLDYHKGYQRAFAIKCAKEYGTVFMSSIDRHILNGIETPFVAGDPTAFEIGETFMATLPQPQELPKNQKAMSKDRGFIAAFKKLVGLDH